MRARRTNTPLYTVRAPDPCSLKGRSSLSCTVLLHGPCADSCSSLLAASCYSAHSPTSVLNQRSNDASQKLIPFHFCSKPSIQTPEVAQISDLKSQFNFFFSKLRSLTHNSPQNTTPETQIDGDQQRLQLIQAERRQRKLIMVMMVMEAIVRLQEEEKKELGFLGKKEEERKRL